MEKNSLLTFFEVLSSKIKCWVSPKNTISTLGLQIPNLFFFSPQSQNSNPRKRVHHNSVSKFGFEGLFFSFRNLTTFILICFLFFSFQIFGQIANVNPPSGYFHIDGNLRANTPTIGIGDWLTGLGGSGGFVMSDTGIPIDAATTKLLIKDNYKPTADLIFSSGSKFDGNPNGAGNGGWSWTSGNTLGKDDINNSMYHVSTDASNNRWLIIGSDRLATTGTSYIDFEFLQNTLTRNSSGSGFTTAGIQGGRTVNDIVLSMEYTGGGSAAKIHFYKWQVVGNGFDWVEYKFTTDGGTIPASSAFGMTNATSTEVPFLAFGNNSYIPYSFVEAAINLTAVFGSIDACLGLNVKTIFIKTKASDALTAALKDFVDPIQVTLNFNAPSIDSKGPLCVNASPIQLTASPPGGTFSGTGVSGSTFNPATAGAGSHLITYTFSASGCIKTATTNIVVNANPTATVNSPTKCTNDAAVTITATPGSGAGTDYNYAWTVPGGANPGNVQSFTTGIAGTYSVVITNKTTSCASASASGTVTVNANPTATVNSPTKCANDAAVTITATPGSGAGTDYNYAWTVPGGANPGNVQSFTTGIAGTYSVVITNKTTSCASASASGTVTVNANPTATVNSPTKCANDAAVTITATPGSGAGTDYNYAWTVPGGANPGNVQSFTTGIAGTYSVVITNKTTSCASASASGR